MATITRQLPTKQITKRDKVIDVTTHHVQHEDGQHVFHVRCEHDGLSHEAVLTVGAANAHRPESYTKDQLQADLDAFRNRLADELSWKHHVGSIVTDIE